MQSQQDARLEAALKLAAQFSTAQLPGSLAWIYGFGFKIGVFLILKSFLVLRYLSLSATGVVMVATQLALAVVLMVLGLIMQERNILEDAARLRAVLAGYGLASVVSGAVCYAKSAFSWTFFQNSAASNWFFELFNSAAKGVKEITLSVIFWDADLWTFFCLLLFILTFVYARIYKKRFALDG